LLLQISIADVGRWSLPRAPILRKGENKDKVKWLKTVLNDAQTNKMAESASKFTELRRWSGVDGEMVESKKLCSEMERVEYAKRNE
jgi:hypothetical protein